MQIENDYAPEVYNGDLGLVTRVEMEESEIAIDFESREIVYGSGKLDALIVLTPIGRMIQCEGHSGSGRKPWQAPARSVSGSLV